MNEEQLYQKLCEAFQTEAEERLNQIFLHLITLEKDPDTAQRKTLLEDIYRDAHSLKGAARAVNYYDIEKVCQTIESLFSGLKDTSLSFSRELFDALFAANKHLESLLAANSEKTYQQETSQILDRLEALIPSQAGASSHQKSTGLVERHKTHQKRKTKHPRSTDEASCQGLGTRPEDHSQSDVSPDFPIQGENTSRKQSKGRSISPILSETVRIPSAKLDDILLKAEELIPLKLWLRQHLQTLRELQMFLKHQRRDRPLSHEASHGLPVSQRPFSEQDQISVRIAARTDCRPEALHQIVHSLVKTTQETHSYYSRRIDELLEDMKESLMLPFSYLTSLLPKVVRELARDQNKEVSLSVSGDDVEIDRRILQNLKDPLLHLIRNALDHGLESPEKRKNMHKSAQGSLTLDIARKEGSWVEMSLQDDGQGIDLEKIKERAVEKQILKPKQAQDLSDQETMSYIFHPDISSSPIITEISGRGIGMSVVQTSLEQLGGRIKVDSQRNQGTTFTLKLPVTLTTLRGLLVQIHTQHYIIPCANVLRILRIQAKDIKSIDNKEAIQVNDQILSLIDPAIVLGIAREGNAISQTWFKAVTVVASGQCLALYIDEIIDEQEILVKGLGKQLQKVPNISGATILASGQVVPVLDIPDLIKASVIQYQTQDTLFSVSQRKRDRQKSVLVVEDTLTSRMLIKNVLEASGYHILTANDGQEAWVSLQSQYCDCVVSDVEMPRMDGFELTTRIRNDNDLVNLPVILITARDSKEDREKGIEAGANAYIVKSNFDQNNLLEALDRLI